MNKIIGVIGGLGPKATTYFMDLIIDNTKSSCDQDNVNLLVCQYSSIPDRTSYILGKSTKSPVPEMINCAKLLERENCKYIVIPCNTASYFYDEIAKEVNIPVINILEETSKEVLKTNPNKIGLMATDGTIKSKAYQKFIDEQLLFIPNQEYQNKIMTIIYDKIKQNTPITKQEFDEIINYFKQNNCDKIILGCTELSVAYKALNLNYDTVVDSLTVLAKKTIELSGKTLINKVI